MTAQATRNAVLEEAAARCDARSMEAAACAHTARNELEADHYTRKAVEASFCADAIRALCTPADRGSTEGGVPLGRDAPSEEWRKAMEWLDRRELVFAKAPTNYAVVIKAELKRLRDLSDIPFEIVGGSMEPLTEEQLRHLKIENDALSAKRAAVVATEPKPPAEPVLPGAEAAHQLSVALATLEAYEADYGEPLPDMHDLGRIEESRGSPSFRIRVGHIRGWAAAAALTFPRGEGEK